MLTPWLKRPRSAYLFTMFHRANVGWRWYSGPLVPKKNRNWRIANWPPSFGHISAGEVIAVSRDVPVRKRHGPWRWILGIALLLLVNRFRISCTTQTCLENPFLLNRSRNEISPSGVFEFYFSVQRFVLDTATLEKPRTCYCESYESD
jgi:hypothetical protein